MALTFHHVALTVSDVSASLAFYQKLGFALDVELAPQDGAYGIYRLSLGDVMLELFANEGVTGTVTEEFAGDLKTIGLKHIALRSDDVERTVDELAQQGIKPASEIRTGKTVPKYCFFRDPDGNWVEVLQV